MSWARFFCIVAVVIGAVWLGYPAAFIATHGLDPQGWPSLEGTAATWFSVPGRDAWSVAAEAIAQVVRTYKRMALGESSAFADGGTIEVVAVFGTALSFSVALAFASRLEPLRHRTTRFGDARFAPSRVLSRMRTGIELGLNPSTRGPVRMQVEGNLITIAPPRSGKTGGVILPNLTLSEPAAYSGPVVVVDPKGDAHRASRRRRLMLGRKVRCLDPLGLSGGEDRWNPLLQRAAGDILYLQAMAQALLPAAAETSESGAFFRDRASVILVAAMLVSIREGRNDVAAAAMLVRDPDRLLAALTDRDDAVSGDARSILTGDDRSRSNILATAGQALSWLLDPRMQAVVKDHSFEISEICDGETDLFIVLPADDRRGILAPYVRWLLADLFGAVREQRVRERVVVFVDEAYVLGNFNALLSGSGELPGYGISLWTFWQSEAQITDTYGSNGAAILRSNAEVVQIFNLSRANPDECRRWSEALGTYTGVDETETKDPLTGRITTNRGAASVPLVHPAALPALTQRNSLVFLNSSIYTADPLKLAKTRADQDARFTGLLDLIAPVGATGRSGARS